VRLTPVACFSHRVVGAEKEPGICPVLPKLWTLDIGLAIRSYPQFLMFWPRSIWMIVAPDPATFDTNYHELSGRFSGPIREIRVNPSGAAAQQRARTSRTFPNDLSFLSRVKTLECNDLKRNLKLFVRRSPQKILVERRLARLGHHLGTTLARPKSHKTIDFIAVARRHDLYPRKQGGGAGKTRR